MKLFIKRDISTEDSAFTVFDKLGREVYYAVFVKSNSALKLNLIDTQKNIVLKIRKLPIVGTNTFSFKADKSKITFVIVRSAKGVFCNFYGNNWHIAGDIFKKNYSIINVDNSIVATHKKCGESAELNIIDEENSLYCIATALCISLINTVDNLAVQTV